MNFFDLLAIFAALLTSGVAMSGPAIQEARADIVKADNTEDICRPRLSKNHFTTVIMKDT